MNNALWKLWWLFLYFFHLYFCEAKCWPGLAPREYFPLLRLTCPAWQSALGFPHAYVFHHIKLLCQRNHVSSRKQLPDLCTKPDKIIPKKQKYFKKLDPECWCKGCVLWKDLKQFRCLCCSRDFEHCEVLRKAKYSRKFKSLWHRKYLRWFKRLCPL